jgi:signal transduction histidine kinase
MSDLALLLFDHHPDPMWIHDRETLRFLAVNDAALKQYGYSRDEFLAMDVTQIRAGAEQPSSSGWHRRRDGGLIDVEVTSHSVPFEQHDAILVSARDVSERIRNERLLEAIFEHVTDPVVVYGLSGEMLRVNPAARALFRMQAPPSPGAVSGPDLVASFRPRDFEGEPIGRENLAMMRVLRGETLTRANPVNMQIGPRRQPLLLTLTGGPIRDQRGEITGGVVVAHDVTERRRLEEQAQAGLLEMTREMEDFLSLAGHELRTPLTSIIGNIQLAVEWLADLAGSPAHPLVRRFDELGVLLDRTQRQGRVMNRLVNDLLDTSRIASDRLSLRLEPVDLVALVRAVLDEHRLLFPGRRFDLTASQPSLFVSADSDRIAQVVMHLLSNAHKFSSLREPISVGVERQDETARVWVRDFGPGLRPAEQNRVWDRFYRVPGVGHRAGSSVGLGLGLYLSRVIVERHAGEIGCDSQPGAGATFWFRLRLELN